jgi:NAD(P)-dependent dehydrogenase (short-subunit alcohol dehydrogenase family)
LLKVLITGGAKGIGREIAMSFALAGNEVIVADRDDRAGSESIDAIRSVGGIAGFIHTDVSVPSDITLLFKTISERFKNLDILINNAGFGIWKSPDILSLDEWDSVINTNLRGTFLCSKAAAAIMRLNGKGSIINIASTRAIMSEPGSEAYAASKGGLVALTHAMAASYAKDNIRVNCISPGWIETGDYEKLCKTDHAQHFSGRVGKPADIAKACIFLSENDFINGENIIIDGGMTRKMIYEP